MIKTDPRWVDGALCVVTDPSEVVPTFDASEARACPTCQSLIHLDDCETRLDRSSSVCHPPGFPLRVGPLVEVSQVVRIYREALLRPRGTAEGFSEQISRFEQIVQGCLKRADCILANKQSAP